MKNGRRRTDGILGRYTDAAAAVLMVIPGAVGAAVAYWILTVILFTVAH